MRSIYIYGASGHGLVVADIAKSCGYDTILWLDDGDNHHTLFKDRDRSIPIALGIGNNKIRASVMSKILQLETEVITLIHPSAIIAPSVTLGQGVVVMPNVVINAQTQIGDGCILNSSAVIEHEIYIGAFVHISPNVALAGAVSIFDYTHVGIGSCAKQGISIGENTIIGAGSVVVTDIGDNKKAYGNPCKERGSNP